MSSVAVMGSGSWGTAFAALCVEAGSDVTLWARRPEVAEEVTAQRTNDRYLPGVTLPVALGATSDPAEALAGAAIDLFARASTAWFQIAGARDVRGGLARRGDRRRGLRGDQPGERPDERRADGRRLCRRVGGLVHHKVAVAHARGST